VASGVLKNTTCTWTGSTGIVILAISDAQVQQIQAVVNGAESAGGKDVPGLGSKAVIASEASGDFILYVLDAKGGFGLSIHSPGQAVTEAQGISLAKLVEGRR